MRRTCMILWVAAALPLTAGCKPAYDGLRVRILVGDGDARGGTLTVSQGEAMQIQVRPESSNPFEDYEKFNLVELESFNESIVRIFPSEDVDRFVVTGEGLGRASVEVRIDGRAEDMIEAEVVPQEAF